MQSTGGRSQMDGALGHKMELSPAVDLAKSEAERRGGFDATIIDADQTHPHKQFACQVWIKRAAGIFGLSIKYGGFCGMDRPERPAYLRGTSPPFKGKST